MADVTVSVKLTPAEHRLIRSAVEEAAENARLDGRAKNPRLDPSEARQAREREAQLRLLLERL